MKTGTLATRLTLAAILLTVLIYFGVNVAAYFNDPFTTTLAYGYTSESAVTVAGYVVREEEVLTGQGDLIYVSRREGEKVSQGGTVALIYPSQEALDNANTLRDLEALPAAADHHPAQPRRGEDRPGGEHPQVGLDPLPVPQEDVQGAPVQAVQVGIGAALLHHKHVHPQAEDLIELVHGELVKGLHHQLHAPGPPHSSGRASPPRR